MHELKPWLQLIFRRPGRLVMGGVLILATLISGIGLLALSGWFITETALVGLVLAAGLQATIDLYTPGSGIRFFAISRTVARYLERIYNHETVLRLLTDIRVSLFRQLAATSRSGRRAQTGAQWLSRLTTDVDALDTLYLRLIAPTALAGVVSLILLLMAWAMFNGHVALVLTPVLVAALLLVSVGTWLRTRQISWQQSDRQEELRTTVIEHLEGFAELTAAGRAPNHARQTMEQAEEFTRQQARADTRVGWHQAGSNLLINLSAVLALWTGFTLFDQGLISGPVLVLLPIALLGLGEVYGMIPDAFGKLGATQASAARLNRDTRKENVSAAGCPAPSTGMALEARDLTIRYGNEPPLFTHLNLQVATGERLGIIGQSGSGKSSLADVLAGVLAPAHGTLARERVSYLTQKTVLFEDTLRTNLLLGSPNATDAELWQVLELVEMADRFSQEPDQLDTWLGSAGSRLSGGEARRVVLARVLLHKAPLVILDEPFTGVDTETRERICKRLDQWLEGLSVISLAHGPDALPGTDRILHLPL